MLQNSSWYSHELIDAGIWAINEQNMVYMFLIEGSKKALLIDTGWGLGNLKDYVRCLTARPLIIVNSHGHPDHVSGNYHFESANISRADIPLMNKYHQKELRELKLRTAIPHIPEQFDTKQWIDAVPSSVAPIEEGHIFNLGGRIIEVIAIPGHTQGSIALLDHKEGLLFTGDSLIHGEMWFHTEGAATLSNYQRSLQKLLKLSDRFEKVISSHGQVQLPPSTIEEIVASVESIINGKQQGTPYSTFAGDGLLCQFDKFRIVYTENRIGI